MYCLRRNKRNAKLLDLCLKHSIRQNYIQNDLSYNEYNIIDGPYILENIGKKIYKLTSNRIDMQFYKFTLNYKSVIITVLSLSNSALVQVMIFSFTVLIH